MRLGSIASGSSGNAIYVGNDNTHILVDAGISGKRIVSGINELNLDMSDIDGILITHEHSDHIAGLGVISRKYGIPIYTTAKTKRTILRYTSYGVIDENLFVDVRPDEPFFINDMVINPMRISHDASDPVAYRFYSGNEKAAVCTDLGTFDDYTVDALSGMDILFLEANHDVRMLQVGPYPFVLKQRILSDKGHLSNEMAGTLLSRVLHENLKAVMLGHLSKENNIPELAYESVRCEVTMNCAMSDSKIDFNDIPLYVAKRSELSKVINIA